MSSAVQSKDLGLYFLNDAAGAEQVEELALNDNPATADLVDSPNTGSMPALGPDEVSLAGR